MASYHQGLLVALELLGLSAPSSLQKALEELRALALTRAQLTEQEVRHPFGAGERLDTSPGSAGLKGRGA